MPTISQTKFYAIFLLPIDLRARKQTQDQQRVKTPRSFLHSLGPKAVNRRAIAVASKGTPDPRASPRAEGVSGLPDGRAATALQRAFL